MKSKWDWGALGVLICAFLPLLFLAFFIGLLVLLQVFSRDFLWLVALLPVSLATVVFAFFIGGFCSSWCWTQQEIPWEKQGELLFIASLLVHAPLFFLLMFNGMNDAAQFLILCVFTVPTHFSLSIWGASSFNSKKFDGYTRYFLGQTPYKPGEEPTKNTRDD